MARAEPIVYVVDDDASVRQAVGRLLRSRGYCVATFATAREFLRGAAAEGPCCVVLDVRMPGASGLELQERLAAAEVPVPIVFLTGHGTIPMSVEAMRLGAADFLTKPVGEAKLVGAVERALARGARAWRRLAETRELRRRLDTLTPREREVLDLVVAGRLNKQIAGALGISEKTVKAHRGRVMTKLRAPSLAELVRLAARMGIPETPRDQSPMRGGDQGPIDGAERAD